VETMRRRKSHIAPLAFLMLILFVSPITVKALHHHLPEHISAFAQHQGKSISEAVVACPVCQFEFVTFITCDIPEYNHFVGFTSFDCCEPTRDLQGNFFTYYSLRAPPVY
jgi:hypothetical protein